LFNPQIRSKESVTVLFFCACVLLFWWSCVFLILFPGFIRVYGWVLVEFIFGRFGVPPPSAVVLVWVPPLVHF
jgi:hypothetical protein